LLLRERWPFAAFSAIIHEPFDQFSGMRRHLKVRRRFEEDMLDIQLLRTSLQAVAQRLAGIGSQARGAAGALRS